MPRKKRPHVATPDEVVITRDGDFAIIAYTDTTIETTQYRVGAERLTRMSDEDILTVWNAGLATSIDEAARSRRDMSGLLTRFADDHDGGGCLVGTVEGYPNAPNQPFLRVNGRSYTAMELANLLGGYPGWEVKIEVRRADGGPDSRDSSSS